MEKIYSIHLQYIFAQNIILCAPVRVLSRYRPRACRATALAVLHSLTPQPETLQPETRPPEPRSSAHNSPPPPPPPPPHQVRLPSQSDGRAAADVAVVEWLAAEHKVAVIPGSACGFPGLQNLNPSPPPPPPNPAFFCVEVCPSGSLAHSLGAARDSVAICRKRFSTDISKYDMFWVRGGLLFEGILEGVSHPFSPPPFALPAAVEEGVPASRSAQRTQHAHWGGETDGTLTQVPGARCLAGHIRVCYSNLAEDRCREAAARLRAGLLALAAGQGP